MATLASRITDLAGAVRDKLNLMTALFKPAQLSVVLDGGGAVLATGAFVDVRFEFACTIQGWAIYADPSGSIQFDLWKVAHASFPPNVGNTITASAKPAISSTTKGASTILTGWTTAIAAGDVIRFRVDSATTVTKATIALKLQRT